MGALLPSVIAQRFVDALTADPPGFAQASVLADVYGFVPGSLLHKGFAVSVVTTTPIAGRQRAEAGTHVEDLILVRWSYILRPTDQWTDYKDALDAEQTLIAACMAADSSMRSKTGISFVSASREVIDSGAWVIGDLQFSALHQLSLT